MRLALLADIHGNLAALEAVLEDLGRRSVDRVINLGDHASGPLLPLETVDLLRRQRGWLHLAGNHERQLLTLEPEAMNLSDQHTIGCLGPEELAWMAGQTSSRALGEEARLADVWLCHGSPGRDSEYLLETVTAEGARAATAAEVAARLAKATSDRFLPDRAFSLIACAHTHLPRAVRSTHGVTVINPGSVGLPAYRDDSPFEHVMESGSPDARYAIAERRDRGWICEGRTVPYDFETMATLADDRGRGDWARALRTGYAG